jgi:prepilin-type N-terminal cleavage/methylation domain-containing protein
MKSRRGVSLVEVLVASVLLGVGIAGTMNALAASARLRVDADAREAVAGLMMDRLAWFESRECSGADTAGVTRLADGPEARWSVSTVSGVRRLALRGTRRPGSTRVMLLNTSLPCS